MSLTFIIQCGSVDSAYVAPGVDANLGAGTYDHGWFLNGGATTLAQAFATALDGLWALSNDNAALTQETSLARFTSGLISLNGGAFNPISSLPAGFTPVTAQVDCSVTSPPETGTISGVTLQFDKGTISATFTSANITANVVFSFVYPGTVPPILDLYSGGFGVSYYQAYSASGIAVQVPIDLLQISGTYVISAAINDYWSNPVTNHKRYAPPTPPPPGGNWVQVPKFVPVDTAITPAVGSTSGGDFVSITGVNFDDSAAFNTTIGGLLITSPVTVNSTLITGFTQAHAAGAVNVVLTNLDGSTSTLVNGFTYAAPQWWSIPPGTWTFGGPPTPVPPVIPVGVPPVPQGATPPTDTQGWYWSNTGFNGSAFLALSPGNPQHARGWDKIAAFATEITSGNLGGLPSVNYKNTIIYAGDDYTLGATNPTVRLFDGIADRSLVTIPNTSAGVVPQAIMSMLLVGTIVYISTFDSGTTHLNFAGRVFAYDILAQTLTPMATGFSSGEIPYALAWHMDRLWVGTNHGDGSLGVVYWIRPNIDTAWTTETGTITGSVVALQSFGGQLYIACCQAAGTFAKIYKRNSNATYSVVATGTGGTARLNNGWLSLSVFNGVLYSGYWNPDTTAIAKVYSITTAGVVALVYTGATDTLAPYLAMFIVNKVLYILGAADEIQVALISTPDGITFTDLSAEINTLNTETAIPVFGVIGY